MASSKLPRFLHRWRAWLGGYFWIPCPLCGDMWGGHEWKAPWARIPDPIRPGISKGICNECALAVDTSGDAE